MVVKHHRAHPSGSQIGQIKRRRTRQALAHKRFQDALVSFTPALLHVFSCEPGIYLPGRFGIRIEDLLVMGENGVQSLNTLSKELTIL